MLLITLINVSLGSMYSGFWLVSDQYDEYEVQDVQRAVDGV